MRMKEYNSKLLVITRYDITWKIEKNHDRCQIINRVKFIFYLSLIYVSWIRFSFVSLYILSFKGWLYF